MSLAVAPVLALVMSPMLAAAQPPVPPPALPTKCSFDAIGPLPDTPPMCRADNTKCVAYLAADLKYLQDILKTPGASIAVPSVSLSTAPSVGKLDGYVRAAHTAYKQLKQWNRAIDRGAQPKATCDDADATAEAQNLAKKAEGQLRRVVHDLMQTRGLRNIITGEFVSGYVLTNTGPAGEASSSSTSDTTSNPQGYVKWSTQHLGANEENSIDRLDVDVSLGGRFGFQPALTLVMPVPMPSPAPSPNPSSGSTAGNGDGDGSNGEEAGVTTKYQEAFVWDFGLDVHGHLGDHVEVGLSGRLGQVRLNSNSTLAQNDGGDFIAVPFGSATGRSEWFSEVGVSFKAFAQHVRLLHEQNGLTKPAIEVSLAYRKDNRFKLNNDDGPVVFDSPDERFVFRFMLNGIRVTKPDPDDSDKTSAFTIGFGVEHEWGWRTGGVPAGTRLIVAGKLNFLKALRGAR